MGEEVWKPLVPMLSEETLYAHAANFLRQESKELFWAGADEREIGQMTKTLMSFLDYLRENAYGSRN